MDFLRLENNVLFFLEDEIADIVIDNGKHMAALENILMSAHNGKNFIIANRLVQRWLSANKDCFSMAAQGIIKKLKHTITNYGALVNGVNIKVMINTRKPNISQITNGGWYVNLDLFHDHNIHNEISLVSENLDDCDLLKSAATAYQIQNKFSSFTRISCDSRLGGGSTTSIVLMNEINCSQKMTLCVIDSDRYAPLGAIGPTAKNCELAIRKVNYVTELVILQAREIENAIPNKLVRDTCQQLTLDHNTLDVIENAGGMDEIFKYVDYKKGTCVQWVNEKFATNTPAKKFWESFYTKLYNAGVISDPTDFTCAAGSCANCNLDFYKNCNWVIFHKISTNLASQVRDHINSKSNHNLPQYSDCKYSPDWDQLGQTVFEWSMAHQASRI
jgi:hypothetical protein